MSGLWLELAVVLGVLAFFPPSGRAGIVPQTRVRGSYGVSNCNAFAGQLGRILACDSYAAASGFDPDDVFCVTRLTGCEDRTTQRRNLLQLPSRVTVTLDTLLDDDDAEEKAKIGTANTTGFRDSFIANAVARGAPERVVDIIDIDIEDEGAITENPEDEPGECGTDTECVDYYYLKPFCLIPLPADVPFPTECVECLTGPYCPDTRCGCDADEICVDFECKPDPVPTPATL